MRSRTRTVFTLLMTLAMVAALAPAALAGKGNNSEKPGKRNAFSVEVETVGVHGPSDAYVYEEPGYPFYWVNAVGDQYEYVLTANGEIIETVRWQIGSSVGSDTWQGPVEVNATEYRLSHTVAGADMKANAVSAVFVATGPGDAEATTSFRVDLELEADCLDPGIGLSYSVVDGVHVYEGELSDVCRWTPVELGTWDVALTPTIDNRGFSVSATLRDHVPGNWCAATPESGMVSGRYRGEAVTGVFYLPDGSVPGEQAGICLAGGAGGATMAVGNTSDFVLRTGAHIRLTKDVTQP